MNRFNWQRAVIKVGSALIAPEGNECSGRYLLSLARFITASREAGKEIILVSSGSVAAGRSKVKIRHNASIAEKQAMAAIGQNLMMANWQRFFDFPCAQVLLTADDLRDRTRYVNIKNTLREILNHNALPIVNENDTVAVNELKVGDNDNLGAYTALVAQADTLIICSDIDGLFTADPRKDASATLIPQVDKIDSTIYGLAGGAAGRTGGGFRRGTDVCLRRIDQRDERPNPDADGCSRWACWRPGRRSVQRADALCHPHHEPSGTPLSHSDGLAARWWVESDGAG